MSTIYDGLVLHLKLDELDLQTQKVPDSSDPKNPAPQKDGVARGGVSLVADDRFGACLQFDGTDDYITVDKTTFSSVTNTFTMAVWVAPTTNTKINLQATLGGSGTGQKYVVFPLHGDGNFGAGHAGAGISVGTNGIIVFEHAADYIPSMLVWDKMNDPALTENGWTHIAVVYQNKVPSLYVNGKQVATGLASTKEVHPSGEIGGGGYGYFPGKISNVRIYNRALSVGEIQQVIDADKLALPAYRAGHPIAFKLFDDNQDYVLYISDVPKPEHILQLELTNTASQAIQFLYEKDKDKQPIKKASATNHHFELLFRPNTLSRKTIDACKAALNAPTPDKTKILKETSVWDIALSDVTDDGLNQFVSLYLLYQGDNFEQSEKHIITLQNMTAEASTGTRGTQVELKLNHLTYVGGPSSTTGDPVQITGSRVQNLHITNHSGRKNIPLHVGFVGSNRILNDGGSHPLTLRITNTSKESLSLEGANFTFSFDVGAVSENWAIATDESNINVKAGSTQIQTESADTGRGVGISKGWRIEKDTLPSNNLAPNEHIEIIFNIQTNHPSGYTNLYIDYSVPGYWDGQFVCVIEKAPLLFAKNKVGVGIGVTPDNIKSTLDVKGGAVIGATYAGTQTAPSNGLLVEGNIGIGRTSTDHALHVGVDKSVRLELGSGQKLSLGGNGSFEIDAPNNSKGRFVVTQDGNVGIGTPTPINTLDVKGGVVVGATYAGSKPAPSNGLFVEGTVEIGGDTTIISGLSVQGNVEIKGKKYPGGKVDSILFLGDGYNYSTSGGGSSKITYGSRQSGKYSEIDTQRLGLVVGNTSSNNSGLALGQQDGVAVLLEAAQAGGYIGTVGNHKLILRTNDTARLTIDENGDVHITGKLFVNGNLIAQ